MGENIATIEKMRKKFLIEFENKPQLYHQIDVDRVRTENWQIERFILGTDNEDKAYKSMTEAFKWKKSFGLYERNDQYFPKEFYIIFNMEISGCDKEGRLVMWSSEHNFKKLSNMNTLFKQFLAHETEKIDRKSGNKGWVIVFDASGSSLTNLDMSLNQFRVELTNYYPLGTRLSFNVDLPSLLNSAFKVITGFASKRIRDSVKFAKKEELPQFFDIDVIPISLGGSRSFKLPDGLILPLYQLKHLGLTDKEVNSFYDTFKSVFVREIS